MSHEDALRASLCAIDTDMRAILEACLEDREPTWEQGVVLSRARGRELFALCQVADAMRARQAGDLVTYVVNRNINFTNVCVKSCRFCAFSRDLRSEQAYYLDTEEVVRRALEAYELGATEVCVQAGLAPDADGRIYIDLCQAIKRALPDMHVHGFSPEEIKYGALRARMSVREYLTELRAAGLGSLPGTSAEILDDTVRERISPGRITTAQWMEVIETAHELGLATTATMMFGHVETLDERMRHLDTIRTIQKRTGGFTEFVPLSFVHAEAPLFAEQTGADAGAVRAGPTGDDIIALYAVTRLMLGPTIANLQASWVKEGLRMAQWLLACGVNDLGGTLMNESISTSAGASHGQLVTPASLRRIIRDAGRIPAQRDTRYGILREFPLVAGAGEDDEPLSRMAENDGRFGSYHELTRDQRFRYRFDKSSVQRRRLPTL